MCTSSYPIFYKKFRNPDSSKSSLGNGLKRGYSEIFAKDETCYKLDKNKFKGLVMEATGEPHDSKVLELMVNSFWNAKTLADFDKSSEDKVLDEVIPTGDNNEDKTLDLNNKKINLGLNYTINLVLPKTDDPSVYNAIFKSLRDNLLKN